MRCTLLALLLTFVVDLTYVAYAQADSVSQVPVPANEYHFGIGIGYGPFGAIVFGDEQSVIRTPLVGAFSYTTVLHPISRRMFAVAQYGVQIAYFSAGESNLEVVFPAILGVQYGGIRNSFLPFGIFVGFGPVLKTGDHVSPAVLSGALVMDAILGARSGKRLRLYLDVIPGSADAAVVGGRRYSQTHSLTFLWPLRL